MPRGTDRFWKDVERLDNNRWRCNFCRTEYRGNVTRIKAHLAGLERYGIQRCKFVNDGVRSEALKAMSKGPVHSSNGSEGNVQGSSSPRFISSSLTQGPHQPMTSFATMSNLISGAISTVDASSSAFVSMHETNVPSHSLFAPNVIPQQDLPSRTSFATMPNLISGAISTVDASSSASLSMHETNVPSHSLFAPNVIPQQDLPSRTSFATMPNLISGAISTVDASSSAFLSMHETNVPSHSLFALNVLPQQDLPSRTSFATMPNLISGAISTVDASSSAFLSMHETNVPSHSLFAPNMIPQQDLPSRTQSPLFHDNDSCMQLFLLSSPSSGGDLALATLTDMRGPENAVDGEPNTEAPQDQSHAGDSYSQPQNFSNPLSRPDGAPEALTNMPCPQNAEEGEPNTEVPQDARTDDALVDSRSSIFAVVGEYMPTLKRKLEELSNRVADLDELDTYCRKSERIKDWSMGRAFRDGRSFWAQQVERVDDLSKEVEEILGHCSFQKGLTTHAAGCRKNSPLVTKELVGKESEETIKKICNYLTEDEIFIIGVYGMGGVGKTAILMHVHNRVLENPAFKDVFWVTIPQEFSVFKLQDKIANAVGLDNLLKDKDIKRRASILNRHLKKKRVVLILDGLWMHFDCEDVGIPIEKGGIKLVLTTRSLDVCHEMRCRKIIKIVPLKPLDDLRLFIKKLCFGRELPSKVQAIAESIVNMCRGLPLGIIEIATRMRGVEEVHEWKGMLWKLKKSRVELNVFKELELSYLNLDDSQVQQCFLHLIQEFEESQDFSINKKKLMESFIDEGLLDRIGTRQELHEQGNTILDKLRKSCLCNDVGQEIYLHPLIRDMALHMLRSPAHMVKTYMGLKEIPERKFWTDRLEKVFLQGNEIKDIPYGILPNCPKLTRLSLNDNMFLEAIHESFFTHLKGLKVLDLSKTKITKLPDTIFDLESLETLLLRGCEKLCSIPCIRKLGSLRKLDMSGCAMLEEVPEGMEMLVKLSYLDLRGTEIETLSEGVLAKLVNMQYLAIIKGTEWSGRELKKVQALYCSVPNVETFNLWVRFLEQNSSQQYELWLNEPGDRFFRDMHERHIIIKSCHSIAARADGEIGGYGRALLPKNVQVLNVERCDGVTSLCEVGPLDNLEKLEIEEWKKLEELGAVHFPHLRRLNIMGCSKLKRLLEVGQVLPRLQWFKIEGSEELEEINIAAPFLYSIEVYRCPKMKRVVEWEWVATRLPNLRSIIIRNCEKLEEIIGGPISTTCLLTKIKIEGCNSLKRVLMTHDMSLHLPFLQDLSVKDCKGIEVIIGIVPNMMQAPFLNLIHLTLSDLLELKSICDGTVICLSIESIDITNCPKLKRLPLLDDGLPCPPRSLDSICIDRLTWQSLEWDHSLFQPSLEPLARILGVSNRHNQRMPLRIESCDSIVARVDGEIGGDGRNIFLRNVQVLRVGRGSEVTSLSDLGSLENLEELTIEFWEKLEELGAIYFPQLQGLNINGCSKLKHLSVERLGLPRLRWFKIKGSEELEEINLVAPSLKLMEVWKCPKMKRVVEWDWLATCLPNLESIEIHCCEKLEEIIGGPLPINATCLIKNLIISGCNNMKGVLLTHDMLLHLPFLQEITVKYCEGIEVIIGAAPNMMQSFFPNLTRLTLGNLPELNRICDQIVSCDDIQFIEISYCPRLRRIPLKLRLLGNGLLSPSFSLGQILIDQQTWQSLEWDHRLACISLEPFIEFIGELPPSRDRSPTEEPRNRFEDRDF